MDNILPGNRFRLYRMVTGTPEFVCMSTDLTFTKTKELETTLVPDCENPTNPATNVSVAKSRAFSINAGGAAIMKHYAVMEADFESDAPVPYRIVADPDDGAGAGRWDGLMHITNLQMAKSADGIVKFTLQATGEGKTTFTAT